MRTTYTVYVLECADGTLYTGITTDITRRLAEHKSGKGARYTRAHGARRIVYQVEKLTHGDALRMESKIKKFSRKEKLSFTARMPGSGM